MVIFKKILKTLTLFILGFIIISVSTGIIGKYSGGGEGIETSLGFLVSNLILLGIIFYVIAKHKVSDLGVEKTHNEVQPLVNIDDVEVMAYKKKIFGTFRVHALFVTLDISLFGVILLVDSISLYWLGLMVPVHFFIGLILSVASFRALYFGIKSGMKSTNHRKATAMIIFLLLYAFTFPVVFYALPAVLIKVTGN